MTGRGRGEEGWALIIALIVMTIMAGFAMSTLTFIDGQQKQTAAGRTRETAFNYAEAALNAQIHALSLPGQWPSSTASQYVSTCTESTPATAKCPTAGTLQALFPTADTAAGTTWTTTVRDNSAPAGSGVTGSSKFWTDAMINAAPAYDANGDGQVWVRAQAIVNGKKRTIIALVGVEKHVENLPHDTVLAGSLSISNQGNKIIIDTKGNSATVGPVRVRCTPTMGESTECLGHRLGQAPTQTQSKLDSTLNTQISPNQSAGGYTGGNALDSDALERLRERAIADGTYYTSCPSSLAGAVVFIDTSSACSGYTGKVTYNSASAPGMVILTQGSISIGGTVTYNGLIYHANLGNVSGGLVFLGGNATVVGGVIVDGAGAVVAGSNGASGANSANITYSDAAWSNAASYSNAGLIQNTWREIKG